VLAEFSLHVESSSWEELRLGCVRGERRVP
jgi:hypothetical protein